MSLPKSMEFCANLEGFNRLSADSQKRVARYFELEMYEPSRQQTFELLKNGSVADIDALFLKRLEFGTAGLRAGMGCGFSRMNDVTVMQTSQGVAHHLMQQLGKQESCSRGVVIGFDGRHNSKRYAHVTAAVFLSHGFKVYLMREMTPTPTNPFAILRYKCVAGIQITASHNPKADNGYKLYAANGAQIIPPTDSEIAALIEQELGSYEDFLRFLDPKTGFLANPDENAQLIRPDDDIRQAYMAAIEVLCPNTKQTAASDLKIVYSAMHGVGYSYVAELLKRIGFEKNFYSVKKQQDADPEFPTVAYPNPEEPGAMDLSMAYADELGAPMVIANDPDADRFAAAEKQADGSWKVFLGDELGILFGHRMYQQAVAKGIPKDKMLFICSAVSSRMLQKMAETEGCKFEDTMTGFKWMMNRAIELRDTKGYVPIFTYEEALGYAVSMSVPDKDGVSAAAVWVEMACDLYRQGKTVMGLLTELRKKYGYFVSYNNYFKFTDKNAMADIFAKFRNNANYPTEIGGYKIKRIRDVTTGYDSGESDKKCTFPVTPTAQMVTLYFENGTVLTIRVSGTEPKLKYYSELSGSDPLKVTEELQTVVKAALLPFTP